MVARLRTVVRVCMLAFMLVPLGLTVPVASADPLDPPLAPFDALVMFQTSGDPWTAAEKAALERYQRPATASRRSTTRPTCAATTSGGTTSSAR